VARLTLVDVRILRELVASPRIGVTELAARLGIARNTAHARTERLEADGVVGSRGREVDPEALGFPLTAFLTLEVAQGRLHDAAAAMARVPYVLEAHAVAGRGDILVRVVARNPPHLHEVIDAVLASPGILRSTTAVATVHEIPYRIGPLIDAVEESME
jgi:DNA-binding Lrp family transcriptional regulator